MPVFNNILAGAAGSAGGADDSYKINKSLRFSKDERAHLYRNSVQGDQRTFTWSGWVKRGSVSSYQRLFEANENNANSSHMLTFTWHSGNMLEVMGRTNGTNQIYVTTTTEFYDTSAWYHIVMAVDTTASANTDKVKIYVNGELQDATYHVTTPDNYMTAVSKDKMPTYIGSQGGGGSFFDGYLAEIYFVDGIALAPGSFGATNSTTGVWDPIEPTFTNPNDGTTWSSTLTATAAHSSGNPATYGFDGVPSAVDANTFLAGAGDDCVWDASSYGFTNVEVEVYVFGVGGSLRQWQVNSGTAINEASSAGWQNLGTYSTLSEIRCNGLGSYGGAISAIRLNGVILVDGATTYGRSGFKLNFNTLTSGGTDYTLNTTFSDNNPNKIGGPLINMFDGNFQTRTNCSGLSGDTYNSMTINLPSTLSGTFRAYMRSETLYGTPRIKLFNGNTEVYNQIVNTSNAPGWHSFGNVTFNKIFFEVTLTAGAGSGADFYVWEIDGVPLVNWDFTTDDEGTNSNTFKGRAVNLSDNHYYDDYGSGVDQYIPDQYTRTSDVNSIFTDDNQGIMINWDGKNFIALTATGSSLSLKYINYDGSANNIPVATLHSDTAWSNSTGSNTSSGSAQNNDPITRTYNVTSGSKYYVRTGHSGPGGPMLLLYVTGATIAPISESNGDYDVMFDSPTNGTVDGNDIGNYATLNPQHELSDVVLQQGNLDVRWSAGNGHAASSTIAMSSGKWYWEVNTGANACMGIRAATFSATNWPGSDTGSYGYATDGRKVYNSGYSSFGDAHQRGDIIGVAFDADNGKLWFSRNGTWQASGNPATGANPAFSGISTSRSYYASVGYWTGNTSYVNSVNFGQRPWGYTPPAGFKALCTQNLPDPAIEKSSTAFNTALWDGDGNAKQITGLGFQPELLWGKRRSQPNGDHILIDAVRGTDKYLRSNLPNTEGTSSTIITSFDADGFSIGTSTALNNASSTNVGWAWDAGSSNTSISANSLNSATYNQSQVFTTGLSGSGSGGGFASGREATRAFDGNTTTSCKWTGTADPVLTATFTAISASTLRVKGHFWNSNSGANEDVLISINGGTYVEPVAAGLTTYAETTAAGGTLFIDCTSLITGGQVSSVSVKRRGSTSTATGLSFHAIEIDGKILVDSNQTPANVPSIPSTVRANQDAGFSIVSFTAPSSSTSSYSVGHGLNTEPTFWIWKSRSASGGWQVYSTALGPSDNRLALNSPDSAYNTYPGSATSSVVNLSDGPTASWGGTNIIYAFSPREGFSATGSYAGSGSGSTAMYNYCGFRPAFLMVKRTDQTGWWSIWDTKRNPTNRAMSNVWANDPYYEVDSGAYGVNFFSNGFKMSTSHADRNASNANYIWIAFAQSAFKYSRAH
tara:strand:- start:481 stop:4611 length:4131 start_codon:yes stop_codon:yes gene_type:complete